MNTRTSWLALVLFTVGVLSANASAATVTFTLDLTGPPGTFTLTAADSLGDNGGISSYGIPLTGPIYYDRSSFACARFLRQTSHQPVLPICGRPMAYRNIFGLQPLTGPAELSVWNRPISRQLPCTGDSRFTYGPDPERGSP